MAREREVTGRSRGSIPVEHAQPTHEVVGHALGHGVHSMEAETRLTNNKPLQIRMGTAGLEPATSRV
jgi:hypothetical protein